MSKFTRVLAMLLCVAMLLSMVPAAALAVEASEEEGKTLQNINFLDPAEASKFTVENQSVTEIKEGKGLYLVSSTDAMEPCNGRISDFKTKDLVKIPAEGDWTATIKFAFDQGGSQGWYEFFGFYAIDDYDNMVGMRGGDGAIQDFIRQNGTVKADTNGIKTSTGLKASEVHWFKMKKTGDNYECFWSIDGKTFNKTFSYENTGIKGDTIVIDAYSGWATGFNYTVEYLSFEEDDAATDAFAVKNAVGAFVKSLPETGKLKSDKTVRLPKSFNGYAVSYTGDPDIVTSNGIVTAQDEQTTLKLNFTLTAGSGATADGETSIVIPASSEAPEPVFMVFSDNKDNNRYLTTEESNAFNVFMYNNTVSGTFGDQHMGAIELSLNGTRVATNGDIHLLPTPEQWDWTPAPSRGTKRFDNEAQSITVPMTFNPNAGEGTLGYDLVAEPTGKGVTLKAVLTTDVPADLQGKARFNLEFLPSKYQSKSYQADANNDGLMDTFGTFPLHAQDAMEDVERANLPTQAWYVKEWNEERGDAQPLPFATGYTFSLAPESDYAISVESKTGDILELYDGRNRAQNGWYVLSSMITNFKAGEVAAEWELIPTVQKDWVRTPNVGFSQVGYTPAQQKFATIELDKWDDNYATTASLWRQNADGTETMVHEGTVTEPTAWQRFKYVRYDFSDVKECGLYTIHFGDQVTEIFPIAKDVYNNIWQSTLSGFLAVQMDHIAVREGYRIWHGASHMDDACIGPVGKGWFDGMGNQNTLPASIAERGYKPEQHVDGLNVGGWFDAGDFDIQTSRNVGVVGYLIDAAEAWRNMEDYDTLSVEWDDYLTGGLVEMHRPDGIPDIVQQVAHGAKQLLAQYEVLGGIGGTLEVRTLRQYTHLGDPSSDTDGYIYDPELGENEIVERDGKVYSGKPDDRMLMTSGGGGNFSSNVFGSNSANFAGVAYLTLDYYPELSQRFMTAAMDIWDSSRAGRAADTSEWNTLVQLVLATHAYEEKGIAYKHQDKYNYEFFKARLAGMADGQISNISRNYNALFVQDLMGEEYTAKCAAAVKAYANQADGNANLPYGTRWTTGSGWGGSPNVIGDARVPALIYGIYPEKGLEERILNVVDYIMGRHPATNASWISGIGTKSALHPYNSNRAEESFIPGSILPGHITFNPDYVESMDDFSFLWFEGESIINYQATWIPVGIAAGKIGMDEAEPEVAETQDFVSNANLKLVKTAENEGYLADEDFNVLMYSTVFDRTFGDQHCAGIELIQDGRRVATNGDIHLLPTPEQWDATPAPTRNSREFDVETGKVTVNMTLPEEKNTESGEPNPAVDYQLIAEPEEGGFKLTVKLAEKLPADLIGKAGFNLEFMPSVYIGKSFQADSDGDGVYDSFGVFPLTSFADMEDVERARTGDQVWYVQDWNEERGDAQPLPFATGSKMTFAAEDDNYRIRISSDDGDLMLYDGRNRAQNGWFVLRTLIPADKTEITWHISPDVQSGWTREPSIGHNQAGYEPALKKVAVLELDPNMDAPETATVKRMNADGTLEDVFTGKIGEPKTWQRYVYRDFDFSEVKEPGMYVIEYAGTTTDLFPIAYGVYEDSWQQSLSNYLAVQMDHMRVREAYKIWHNPSHMDDALQAPLNMKWFDGWSMGAESDSPYEPYEHIPGLNVGGWCDAGDFDIQTSRNLGVIQDLALAYQEFGMDYDTLYVDWDGRSVELHRPDGVPDVVQQVKQGILQILGQIENVGFCFPVLEVPSLRQYTLLGDGSKDTDNKVYDASLKEGEVDGLRSALKDDRLAFAGKKNSGTQLSACAALAASAAVLKGYDDELAKKCLDAAVKIWNEEHPADTEYTGTGDWAAAVELLIATDGGEAYKARIEAMFDSQTAIAGAGWWGPAFARNGWKAARILKYLDASYTKTFEERAAAYEEYVVSSNASNPYGVSTTFGMWGGSTNVVDLGLKMSLLHKYFPKAVSADYTYRVANYILGTHPYNDTSWLSGVGTKSMEQAYGSNRADKYYIAGGIVPGYVVIQPNFPEALDDFNFLWFESEYVIDTAAKWVFVGYAANAFANEVIEEPEDLAIVTEPAAFEGKVGDTATFTVEVNREDVSYQWMYSNNNGKTWSKSSMTGFDTASLSVVMKAFRVGQMYKVVVTDTEGNTVESIAVSMTAATAAVSIVEQPADAKVAVGKTATFTVKAEGESLTYQWMYSNNGGKTWSKSTMAGFDTASLSVAGKAFRNGQMYKVVVTDANGASVESAAATLTVG